MPLASFNYDYTNDFNGEDGWLLKPEFNVSMTGTTFAHDIVEHHPKDNGSIEHELMALGAILFGRYQMGYATEEGIARDIAYMFTNTLNFSCDISDIKYVRKLNGDDEWVKEEVLSHIMELVKEYVNEEAEYFKYTGYRKELNKYVKYAKKWVRKGFHLAKKRFKTPETMFDVYNKVAKSIEKSHINGGDYGYSLRVTYQINPEPKAWVTMSYN